MFEFKKYAGGKIGEPKNEQERRERKVRRDIEGVLPTVQGGRSFRDQGERKTIEEAIIEEEKVFTKDEVTAVIEEVAAIEGFPQSQLEAVREFYDASGNLVELTVKVKDARAKSLGWDSIWYGYVIKGSRGKDKKSSYTRVTKLYKGNGTEDVGGGVVAKYEAGRWELIPGNIFPRKYIDHPIEPKK